MKGDRMPSLFHVKGLLGKKRAMAQKTESKAPKSVKVGQSQLDLQEDLLEAALPPKIYAFLIEIYERCVESGSDVIAALDILEKSSIVDKLLDMMLVNEAYAEIAERVVKSSEGGDFRQVFGWRTWLFILAIYKHMISPAERPKSVTKMKRYIASQTEMLGSIVTAAHEAGDMDTVLLTAGFCQWIRWRKWHDALLQMVLDQIGREEAIDRVIQMEQHPRLLIERLLLHHARQSVMKAK
jgi:hypothetical protein